MQLTARTLSLDLQPVLSDNVSSLAAWPTVFLSFEAVGTSLVELIEASLQCCSVKGELNPSQEVIGGV